MADHNANCARTESTTSGDKEKVALACASSGIAAMLYRLGKTALSTFHIPVQGLCSTSWPLKISTYLQFRVVLFPFPRSKGCQGLLVLFLCHTQTVLVKIFGMLLVLRLLI